MSATLHEYWTTGPGSTPLGPPITEPTLREGVQALLRDAWMFLRAPLVAAALAAPLGALAARALMLMGLLR